MLINAIDLMSEAQSRFPNLGLGYLASSLLHSFPPNTFNIRIIDRNVEKELCDFMPDLVGITAVSQNWDFAKRYAWTVKHFNDKKNIPVIVGGAHISSLPETISEDMDIAVMGEGESAFPKIVREFLETGNLRSISLPPLIQPLDYIPFPSRHLLNIEGRAGIFSSRGCPFRCYFCFSSRFWSGVRYFSAGYVYEEIKEIVKRYGINRICFHDDLMMGDVPRLEKLTELIRKDNSLSKVKFKVNARANLINEHTARLLREMHVEAVGMGLESGNQRVLSKLKGNGIYVEDGYAAIVKLHKNRISAEASFVIGFPDETEAEMMDTYRFIKESELDFFDIYVLTPLPGTPAWLEAEDRKLVSPSMEWNRLNVNYSENDNPILLSYLQKKTIDRIYRKFRRERFLRAIRRIWFNPFFYDVCRAGANKIKGRMTWGGKSCASA